MGLRKRVEFDHSQESVFEAAGYSEETVTRELEPRASLLAQQLVHVATTDPMMTIEVLLRSPVLEDSNLDSRDRAVIVMMAGNSLASAFIQHLNNTEHEPQMGSTGTRGPNRLDTGEPYEVRRMSDVEWNTLVHYVERKVFGDGQKKVSEHIERMQALLDDVELSPLQKAVAEVLALKASTMKTGKGINSPSTVSLLL